jgi:hypothetical protein
MLLQATLREATGISEVRVEPQWTDDDRNRHRGDIGFTHTQAGVKAQFMVDVCVCVGSKEEAKKRKKREYGPPPPDASVAQRKRYKDLARYVGPNVIFKPFIMSADGQFEPEALELARFAVAQRQIAVHGAPNAVEEEQYMGRFAAAIAQTQYTMFEITRAITKCGTGWVVADGVVDDQDEGALDGELAADSNNAANEAVHSGAVQVDGVLEGAVARRDQAECLVPTEKYLRNIEGQMLGAQSDDVGECPASGLVPLM